MAIEMSKRDQKLFTMKTMNIHNRHLLILLKIVLAAFFAIDILLASIARVMFICEYYFFAGLLSAVFVWICVVFFYYARTYRKVKRAGENDANLTDKDFL
jgi:hypothetical protein